jgi:hypothetical protein
VYDPVNQQVDSEDSGDNPAFCPNTLLAPQDSSKAGILYGNSPFDRREIEEEKEGLSITFHQ